MSCSPLGGSWVGDGMRISWALLLDWIGQMWELVRSMDWGLDQIGFRLGLGIHTTSGHWDSNGL